MKVVSRNKLFLCCQAVVDMGTILHTKATTTLAAYLELEEDEIRNSNPNCRCPRNSARDCSAVSHPPKRTLSWTARAVVFGTILIKRVRERKSYHQHKSEGRKRSLSLDSGIFSAKEDQKLGAEENRENQVVSLSCLPSGPSQSFPISISEPKTSKEKTSGVRRRDVEQRSWYALNSGVGLVVVSLGVTVMQGRVIAILITSIWVYFVGWMHMEYRGLKNKPTNFIETEVTGTLRRDSHNRKAHGCRLMERPGKRH